MSLSSENQVGMGALNQWTKSLLGSVMRMMNSDIWRGHLSSPCVIVTAGWSKDKINYSNNSN